MKQSLPHVRPHSLGSVFYVLAVLSCVFVLHVHGYPTGAGSAACPKQSPQVCHKGQPQNSTSPYSVIVKDKTYSPGVAVNVTLESNKGSPPFIGFLLGAHRVKGNTTEYLGSFKATPQAQQQCGTDGNSGATHTNNDNKTSITLQWTPPKTNEGDILISSAFVQHYATYWVDVAAATALTPKDYPPPSNDTTTAPPPNTPTTEPPAKFPKDSNCGKTMSCYGDCEDDGCTFLATWQKVDKSLLITFKSENTGGDNVWVALGFGTVAKMKPASVTECIVNNGTMQAFMSYNPGYYNMKVSPDPKVGLSNMTGSLKDGLLTCSVQRLLEIPGVDPSQVFNLTKPYHILLARGPASGWNTKMHAESDAFVTDDSYDVTVNVDIGAKAKSEALMQVHGCLMTVAWILSGSIGLLVARFYKPAWPTQTVCGVKVWFAIHRTAMFITFLITVVGFAVIFIHVGGYSEIYGPGYQKAHPILGIIVTALTVLNPFMALFRCAPDHENRALFNWAHWFVGSSAYILGVLTVGIGTRLSAINLPHFVWYLVLAFAGWHLFATFFLELVKYCEKNDSKVGVYRDLQSFTHSHDAQTYRFIRHFIFAVHVIGALGICIAIVGYIIGFDSS